MNTKFEIIKHSGNLPFSIFLHESNRVYPMNWHKEIEILFVLQGSIRVKIRDTGYKVDQDNIILINSYEMHEITPMEENIVILVFQLDPYFYQKYYNGFTEIIFHMNSTMLSKDPNTYSTIKENLVMMMWYRLNKENTYQIKLLKQSLALVELLLRNFKKTMVYDRHLNDRSQQRLISIIEKINKNYNKKLTLGQIADQEYISIHYLSKFFKNRVGIGFNKYLNLFRLNMSMNDLLNSNKMIIDIALDHGFSSVKAYNKLFKETYNDTPSAFRKKYLNELSPKKKVSYISNNGRYILHNYIQHHAKDFLSGNLNQVYYLNLNMLQKDTTPMKKEKVIQLNLPPMGFNIVMRQKLDEIVSEMTIDFIRFNAFTHIVLSHDSQDPHWFYMDQIIDAFMELDIRPFLTLTYDENNGSIQNWFLLADKFIQHCIQKYGIKKVRLWKFELVCENLQDISQHMNFLKKLHQHNPALTLGITLRLQREGLVHHILDQLMATQLSFVTLEMNANDYDSSANSMSGLLTKLNLRHLQIYCHLIYPPNELNDTCFIGSYYIKQHLSIHCNTTLIVPFMDHPTPTKAFHGECGLLTYNGLKKAIYNVYYLLSKLEGEIISQGDYYLAVKNHDRYYILLYYYQQQLDNILIDPHNTMTYSTYKQQMMSRLTTIVYAGLKLNHSHYKVRTYILNEDNGCVFTQWMNMGAPQHMDQEDMRFLMSKENMGLHVARIPAKDTLHLECSMKSNEIQLVEIWEEN